MRIELTSVFVDDQEVARRFYTEVLGFTVRDDVPLGAHRWLTVVSAEAPGGPALLLEPAAHPAVAPYRAALRADSIPAAQLAVDDVAAETARLEAHGVEFTVPPTAAGEVSIAVFDDTCGNLIQIVGPAPA